MGVQSVDAVERVNTGVWKRGIQVECGNLCFLF